MAFLAMASMDEKKANAGGGKKKNKNAKNKGERVASRNPSLRYADCAMR